jgi:hypothetical protein
MSALKYAAIWLLDGLDAYVLRHSLHRFGLCDFIAWHPWWGEHVCGPDCAGESHDAIREGGR